MSSTIFEVNIILISLLSSTIYITNFGIGNFTIRSNKYKKIICIFINDQTCDIYHYN